MRCEDSFDFLWKELHSHDVDDVLCPPANYQASIRIQLTDVPCAEPAVLHNQCAGLPWLVIGIEKPLDAKRHYLQFRAETDIPHLETIRGQDSADSMTSLGCEIDIDKWQPDFNDAERLGHRYAKSSLKPRSRFNIQRCGCRNCQAERRQAPFK